MADRGTTLQARESFGGLGRILEHMARMRTPVIAQVHGYALAGGCGLAAGADVVVAADDATFGLPEIKVGLLPLIVMAPILRAVGRKRGLLMILSGEPVSAREAYEMGLVSRLVPRASWTARWARWPARSRATRRPPSGSPRRRRPWCRRWSTARPCATSGS